MLLNLKFTAAILIALFAQHAFAGERIWLDDAKGTGQFWDIECAETGCRGRAADLRIYVDDLGSVWLTHPLAQSAQISLYDGAGKKAASTLFTGPVSAVDLEYLTQPGLWIIFERPDQRDVLAQLWGVKSLLSLMSQSIGAPLPQSVLDPSLNHLAHRDPSNQIDPWSHIPHTKPQIEFAIRAQGGVSQSAGP